MLITIEMVGEIVTADMPILVAGQAAMIVECIGSGERTANQDRAVFCKGGEN